MSEIVAPPKAKRTASGRANNDVKASRKTIAKKVTQTAPQQIPQSVQTNDPQAITNTTITEEVQGIRSASQIVGSITGLDHGVLSGWAMDINSPDVLLCVEVYYDDVFGHVVRADTWMGGLSNTDLIDGPEQAQWHGFVVPLDRQWLAQAAKISVRVANQGPWLGGGLQLGQALAPGVADRQAGRLFHAGGLNVLGWAWGGPEDRSFKQVVVYEGEGALARELVRVTANQSLSFLNSKPEQGHGFVVNLPWSIADGKRHHLQLVTDRGEPLEGSPIDVCITANTLTGLIQDTGPINPKLESLLPVISAYERQYPVSFGFAHYPAWCELYQIPPKQVKSALRCAVIVIAAPGQESMAELSVNSVFAQRHPQEQVECFNVQPQALLKGLHAAVEFADVVVPLWAGDQLAPHALDVMAARTDQALTQHEHFWGYADDDVINGWHAMTDRPGDRLGQRSDPWLKPDWDETLFYGLDYVSKGGFFSSGLIKKVLSTYSEILDELSRESLDHSNDSFSVQFSDPLKDPLKDPLRDPLSDQHADDLFDQPAEATSRSSVWHAFLSAVVADTVDELPPVHLRQVLYHRHAREVQTPHARVRSLQWLANLRVAGAKVGLENSLTRVVWPMPAQPPLVTVIVPTRNSHALLQVAMQGLLNHTHYPALELIVVDNDSDCEQTLAYFDELSQAGVKVLSYPKPFNYAAINNFAVQHAQGELLLLLNNDVEIKDPRWLSEMVVQFQRPGVGVVGKKLLWPDGLVQHGGVVVGVNGLAAHAFNDCWADDPGYMGLNRLDREQSAVTAACLMMAREDFLALGGLDETHLPVAFNDVDLCLKVRDLGKRVVITTRFPLIHHESASRGREDTPQKTARAKLERQAFMQRWINKDVVFTDPYYHPGLNHDFLLGPYRGLGKLHRSTVSSGLLGSHESDHEAS